MGLILPEKCLRGDNSCTALSQLESHDGSFICCGKNDGSDRVVGQDIFTVCWKNSFVDERTNWDRRDITDHISILAGALSMSENMKLEDEIR